MFNVKLNFYKILKRKKMKNMIDNEITVLISSDKAILKFPKCALEVSAFIGKNGLTSNKQEGACNELHDRYRCKSAVQDS